MNTKPIIKWVGGKTQIIDKIIDKFPSDINNYHEIFIGGGSVLLALLNNDKIKLKGNVYAYDSNENLINLYKNIQMKPVELYEEIIKIVDEFVTCSEKGDSEVIRSPTSIEDAKLSKENYYYWCRKLYNTTENSDSLKKSALFVFLNKTCFRGVYRTGPNGFNVPYGNYKKPEIVNLEHIKKISDLIKNVKFECCDFSKSLKNVKKGDFVYMDPPYYPEKSDSFVSYTENGFNLENHNKLFNLIKEVDKYARFMMSNSNTQYVINSFQNFKIVTIECKRSINSKKPDSKTNEVIITNY